MHRIDIDKEEPAQKTANEIVQEETVEETTQKTEEDKTQETPTEAETVPSSYPYRHQNKKIAATALTTVLASTLIIAGSAFADKGVEAVQIAADDPVHTLKGYEGRTSFSEWQDDYFKQQLMNRSLLENIEETLDDNAQYVTDEDKTQALFSAVGNAEDDTLSDLEERYVAMNKAYSNLVVKIDAKKDAEERAQRIAEFPADLNAGDWSTEKVSFVSAWGKRLNAYLKGSTLGGYGYHFAAAAYDANIDPRTSAAISTIESTKGAYCFRSHNAWGWGSSGWSSWSEAIFAHARGLSSHYGYDMSASDCATYCPTNGSYYSILQSEMNKI